MTDVKPEESDNPKVAPGQMKRGINYSVGLNFVPKDKNAAKNAAEVYRSILAGLTPEKIGLEMEEIIGLGCDSVRIYGDNEEKLLLAAKIALEKGLNVWISPRIFNANKEDTLSKLTEFAKKVEVLRRSPGNEDKITLVLGNEISIDSSEIFEDETYLDRVKKYESVAIFQTLSTRFKLKKVLQGLSPARVLEEQRMKVVSAGMVKEMAAQVRPLFHGPLTYAALPQEEIDWDDPNLDLVSVNLYDDASHSDKGYEEKLKSYKGHKDKTGREKQVAVTEFGTSSYRGASWFGGASSQKAINWQKMKPASPCHILPLINNREGQVKHLEKLIRLYRKHQLGAAFIFEFVDRITENLPVGADLEIANMAVKPSKPEPKDKQRRTMEKLPIVWKEAGD